MVNIRFNLSSVIIILLSVSTTFYATKLTQLSPIYIFLIPFIIVSLIQKRYVSYSFDSIIVLLMYIIMTQLLFIMTGEFMNLFISLIAYLYIRLIKNKHNIEFYAKNFKYLIRISIFTLSLDTIYRIMNPMIPNMDEFQAYSNSETMWIYIYKYNTFMFAHSNVTALIIVILYLALKRFFPFHINMIN